MYWSLPDAMAWHYLLAEVKYGSLIVDAWVYLEVVWPYLAVEMVWPSLAVEIKWPSLALAMLYPSLLLATLYPSLLLATLYPSAYYPPPLFLSSTTTYFFWIIILPNFSLTPIIIAFLSLSIRQYLHSPQSTCPSTYISTLSLLFLLECLLVATYNISTFYVYTGILYNPKEHLFVLGSLVSNISSDPIALAKPPSALQLLSSQFLPRSPPSKPANKTLPSSQFA